MKKSTLMLAFALFLFSMPSYAQTNTTDTALVKLRKQIDIAFEKYKKKNASAIDSTIEVEMKDEYLQMLKSLKANNFADTANAKTLLQNYAKADGVGLMLARWMNNIKGSAGAPLPIGSVLYDEIYAKTGNPEVVMSFNVPNKYAQLFVEKNPEDSDTEIFLNGKSYGKIKNAKNGILVHSEKSYQFELRKGTKVFCKSTFALAKQEKKVKKCTD